MKEKIILFYKYIPLPSPDGIREWQLKVGTDLQLKGRVILAHEGINATLSGAEDKIEIYKKIMQKHPLFGDIDYKESVGASRSFPRFSVKIKNEIVRLGVSPEQLSSQDAGAHLTPKQVHELLNTASDEIILFDVRNDFESAVGRFENAHRAPINTFRELPKYIDKNTEQFKDKTVLMYCTGGIRCERASAYLKQKGVAKEVYQLSGGIHRYIEQYPDGFFRGKNYVFDGRISVRANHDVLGACLICATSEDEYTNCLHARCNKHFIACAQCLQKLQNTCSPVCLDIIMQNPETRRMPREIAADLDQ